MSSKGKRWSWVILKDFVWTQFICQGLGMNTTLTSFQVNRTYSIAYRLYISSSADKWLWLRLGPLIKVPRKYHHLEGYIGSKVKDCPPKFVVGHCRPAEAQFLLCRLNCLGENVGFSFFFIYHHRARRTSVQHRLSCLLFRGRVFYRRKQ